MSPDNEDKGLPIGGGAIASLVGLALLILFMAQNREDTNINFLMFEVTWPLWLVILISALLGALIWIGIGIMRRHNRRKERRAER